MYDQNFTGVLSHFKAELSKLQTGRATPALVEDLLIEVYGVSQPIKAAASISIPEATSIMISPWDKNNLNAIAKAIQNSALGLNPVNDGICIRLNLPPLTEERRKELAKVVQKIAEEAKIAVRNVRHELMKEVEQQEKDKLISEDELAGEEKKIQTAVDKANAEVEEIADKKAKDIMTI